MKEQLILLKRDVGGKMVMVVEKWRAAVETFGALRSCSLAAIHLSCLLPVIFVVILSLTNLLTLSHLQVTILLGT